MSASESAAVAYSYVRFSTPEQRKGDSLRRQTEATEDWCNRKGVALDKSLTFHDLGKSAFLGEHRKNPDRHRLAAFLKMVEDGRIRRGSYLVIESLDRLTREHVRAGLMLLLGLIEAGVRIVQLSPSELVYDEKADEMALMLAIVELSRGHRESKRKSEVIGPAWAKKKQAARGGQPQPSAREDRVNGMALLSHMTPAWVEECGGQLTLIPERAAAVRRIFELSAAGYGEMLICQRLAAEGFKPFGRSGRWAKAYVGLILRDRRALGEYQPRLGKGGGRNRKPDGDPIPGYFPAVITPEQWEACRGQATSRRKQRGRAGHHVNLFQGLLKDARTGGSYFSVARIKQGHARRVLINNEGTEGREPRISFPEEVFERAVLSRLREIDPHDILNGDGDQPDPSMVLSGQLARVEASIVAIVAEMDAHGESPALFKRLRAKEAEQRGLKERLAEAQQKAAHPLSASWGEAQSLIDILDNAPDPQDARVRLRSAIRRIVESVHLLIVAGGKTAARLCAVQVWFADRDRHRDYLICYRPAKGNGRVRTEGAWRCWSLADKIDPAGLDLRRREDAEALELVLRDLDPAKLVE
jgi:DNA invertase Pin-like site-specific DNA recombinase